MDSIISYNSDSDNNNDNNNINIIINDCDDNENNNAFVTTTHKRNQPEQRDNDVFVPPSSSFHDKDDDENDNDDERDDSGDQQKLATTMMMLMNVDDNDSPSSIFSSSPSASASASPPKRRKMIGTSTTSAFTSPPLMPRFKYEQAQRSVVVAPDTNTAPRPAMDLSFLAFPSLPSGSPTCVSKQSSTSSSLFVLSPRTTLAPLLLQDNISNSNNNSDDDDYDYEICSYDFDSFSEQQQRHPYIGVGMAAMNNIHELLLPSLRMRPTNPRKYDLSKKQMMTELSLPSLMEVSSVATFPMSANKAKSQQEQFQQPSTYVLQSRFSRGRLITIAR